MRGAMNVPLFCTVKTWDKVTDMESLFISLHHHHPAPPALPCGLYVCVFARAYFLNQCYSSHFYPFAC